MTSAANLRAFFANPLNQTTRERIFFNRLSFDIKISSARCGYHLHMYEPDVDRDGFDIVVEHDDYVRWHQTKAVLSSAGTSSWDINAGLLWPDIIAADSYGYDPVEAGRGGGVILIEIDDESDKGDVIYSYTDYDVIVAIAEGFIIQRPWAGRGRPATAARTEAQDLLAKLKTAKRGQKVPVDRKVFIRLSKADNLLGVMGLHTSNGYGMFAIRQAYKKVFIDSAGSIISGPLSEGSTLKYHMGLLTAVQPAPGIKKMTLFDPFTWDASKLT